MASSTERVRIKLPSNFDPARHTKAMELKLTELHGPGFEIESIAVVDGVKVAVATRHVAIMSVSEKENSQTKEIRLTKSVKPGDGDKMATKFQDEYGNGYEMTSFEPYLGKAVLTKLTPETSRCRGAVAVALGVKPWEVQVSPRRDGGFDLELPRTYVPSKHDSKLDEVATTVVGYDGWYIKVNAQKLTASIIPSEPPTFPEGISFPMSRLGKGDVDKTPFGMELPLPGEDTGPEIAIDWTASAWVLVAGTPGSGKRQPLDSRVPVPVSPRFPSGWSTIGQLEVGDEVFAAPGDVTKVDYLSPIVDDEILEFEFSDGQTVRCDPGHLWTVSTRYTRHSHYRGKLVKKEVTDTKQAAEFARLCAIAKEACENSAGADTSTISELTGLSLHTVQTFAKQASLPYLVGARSGQARFYPIDEFIESWIAHKEGGHAGRRPLLKTVEAREIAETFRAQDGRANFAVPLAGCLVLPEADLPIDPYFFGAWLGDGTYDNDPLQEVLRKLGVQRNKYIPAVYLRSSAAQRLALLQGLMDIDGSVDANGNCELAQSDKRLATDALELIRSLGIKASMSESDADTPTKDAEGVSSRRFVGRRFRILFTTTAPVFRMERKLARQSATVRATQDWIYITGVKSVGRAPGRCIRINHPSHLYLTDGFIPTHNTVTLNAIIADSLSNGSQIFIIDDKSKAVDFLTFKNFCAPGGWGCESLEAAVGSLGLVREEGARRSDVLKGMGINNWLDMPEGKRFQPILVIVDEVTALVVPDPVPKGIPKDHPLVLEIAERNLARAMIQSYMRKIVAELRFVGVRMVLSTQATNANTGVDPAMRTLIGHKILQGVNPSKAARGQIFSDESAVLNVPENVKGGGKRAKGVGVAALEAVTPAVYKSYFATPGDYRDALRKLGIPERTDVEPTARQINKFLPTIEDIPETTAKRRQAMPDPAAALMGESGMDENGRPLKGAALAAAQSKMLANKAG